MGNALTVTIFLGNNSNRQSNQVYAGMGILKHRGAIKITFKPARKGITGKETVECIVEDKKIVFDMHDRNTFIDKDSYEWCDVYFKRSATADVLGQYSKMLPWGLNVGLTSAYDFAVQRSFSNFNIKRTAKKLYLSSTFLSRLFNIEGGAYNYNWKKIQQPPVKTSHPIISFSARLWEPEEKLGKEKTEDRVRINTERVEFVRALKKNFPANYKGGVESSPFARQLCPDLVIPASQTNRASYIRSARECSIGIATPGLLNSVGWKFSEYLLLSKAIISNNIDGTVLPQPCVNGVNYLAYTAIDDMLANVEKLVKDEDVRFTMMDNNYYYSQNFMLPHKQLALALNRAGFNFAV